MNTLVLNIEGMHCNSCVTLIREELEDLGARNIAVALGPVRTGTITVSTDRDRAEIITAIEALGDYRVKG
jgi:copper chaperone CopZ